MSLDTVVLKPAEQAGRASLAYWLPLALIAGYWLIACGHAVLLRPPLPVDETRYLSVAWEMFHTGDWLVPSRNFQPYDHKPPLLFWLINAVWSLTGFSVPLARILPFFEAMLVVALTMRLARSLCPDAADVPMLAGMVYSGSVLITIYGTLVMFDQLLTAGILVSVTAVWDAAKHGRWCWQELAALSLGLGLAMLAKGPVALVSVMAVGLGWQFWRPPGSASCSFRNWYGGLFFGVLLGGLILAAWAIPAALTGGEAFAEKLLWEQTAGRMHNSFAHKEPIWWYLVAAPILLAPWVLWPDLWRMATDAVKRWRLSEGKTTASSRMLAIWFLSGLLLFSLISGKKPHYLIQLMPAAAIWIAMMANRLDRQGNAFSSGRLLGLLPILPAFIAMALCGVILVQPGFLPPNALDFISELSRPATLTGLAVLIVFCVFAAVRLPDRRDGKTGTNTVVLLCCQSLMLFVIVHLIGGGFVRREFSPEPMAAYLAQHLGDRPLANIGRYDGELGAFVPLTRPVDELTRDNAPLWLTHHPDGIVLLRDRHPTMDLPGAVEFATRYRNRDWLALVNQSK